MYNDYKNERILYNTKGLNKYEKSNVAISYISAVVEENNDIKMLLHLK